MKTYNEKSVIKDFKAEVKKLNKDVYDLAVEKEFF